MIILLYNKSLIYPTDVVHYKWYKTNIRILYILLTFVWIKLDWSFYYIYKSILYIIIYYNVLV